MKKLVYIFSYSLTFGLFAYLIELILKAISTRSISNFLDEFDLTKLGFWTAGGFFYYLAFEIIYKKYLADK